MSVSILPASVPALNPLDDSAFGLASRLRRGDLSARSLVEAHIARISAVNGPLNALIADRFDAARDEAVAADIRLDNARFDKARRQKKASALEALPPLLGVPFTVKEFIGVAGMGQTGGLVRRRHLRAERDATVVARLRAAGGIVLGQTNVAEGGLWMETFNPVFGLTRNPWDLRRTAGGSTGGEAALIAAGGSPFGIGADIGGSIRIPSAFCGIFGHKPTGGLVPNTGHWPGDQDMGPMLTVGPMCRRAGDLMPLLRLMAGPDGEDPTCLPARQAQALGDVDVARLSGARVFLVDAVGATRFGPTVSGAVRRAGEALRHFGARVETLALPELRMSHAMFLARLMTMGQSTYAEILGNGEAISTGREVIGWLMRRKRHSAPAVILAALERLTQSLPLPTDKLLARLDGLRTSLEDRLGDDGLLIHPVYTRPAPRHYAPLSTPFDFAGCAIFNALEFPATAVPIGFDAFGLPLSVQVVGARGRDPLTISAALALEASLGGWTRAEPRDGRPSR